MNMNVFNYYLLSVPSHHSQLSYDFHISVANVFESNVFVSYF